MNYLSPKHFKTISNLGFLGGITMKKIKSAAELAMEKTKNIKEKRANNATELEQYVQAARKLAQDLIQGKTEVRKIKESLERYPKEVLPEATKVMLNEFSNGINLDNTTRLLQSINLLKDDESTRQSIKEVSRIYQKYDHLRDQKVKEVEDANRKQLLKDLKQEGITGTAIYRISLKKDSRIQKITEEINQEYLRNISGFISYLNS